VPLNLDSYLGVHQDALKLYGERTAVLANNIANADTPNYKARDIDFRSVLGAQSASGTGGAPATGGATGTRSLTLATTSSAHVGSTSNTSTSPTTTASGLKYRVPLAPSLDGNTVDVQLEQAAFADNSVRYQAALAFLADKFKGLLTAITGQ
jgi:flagellar basal-body rod protein FlgB